MKPRSAGFTPGPRAAEEFESSSGGSIALLVPELRIGGAERAMTCLGNEIGSRGWPVDLVVCNARGSLRDEVAPCVRLIDLRSRGVLAAWPRRADGGFGLLVGSAALFESVASRVTGAVLALASVRPVEYLEMAIRAAAGAPLGDLHDAVRPDRLRFEAGGITALEEMHEELGLFGGDHSRPSG